MENNHLLLLCAICLTLITQSKAFAQRSDHIILNDTIFTEGYVRQESDEIATHVYFRKTKKESWKKYSTREVNEYYHNRRKYFAKSINRFSTTETVYLQLIPSDLEMIKVFRAMDQKKQFFLEKDGDLEMLKEDYREVLQSAISNPKLDPLLDITKCTAEDISYFLTSAADDRSRTFSKRFYISPFFGSVWTSNQFGLPNTNQTIRIAGNGFQAGVNIELAVNRLRTLTVNFKPSHIQSSGTNFLMFRDGRTSFETDTYLSQSALQIPITAKYFIDLVPNSIRIYAEAGYGGSFLNGNEGVFQIAELEENSVTTYERNFQIDSFYQGFVGGIGLEKALQKAKFLMIGFQYSSMSSLTDQFSTSSIYLGFKF
ncbi:hypothetical protein [Algoriphagus formosus]|uniref:hypothetical protein n=1 Tax=Algoriphagus formosus TaxID=2007308 RepID=UPI003F72F7A1